MAYMFQVLSPCVYIPPTGNHCQWPPCPPGWGDGSSLGWGWGPQGLVRGRGSLSARGLPLPPPSTLHLGVSLLPPSSPVPLPRIRRDGFRGFSPPRRQAAPSGGSPAGVVTGRARSKAPGAGAGARTSWSERAGGRLGSRRGLGSRGHRRRPFSRERVGGALPAPAPPAAFPQGTAPQVRRRRSRRVCRRAASAGAAEREPGPAAPRVSAGRRRPLLPLPGPGGQRHPRRSRLPRRALCASSERNFLSRDSEAGVSLLLKGSRGGAGAPGRKPRAPEPDRSALGVSRSLGAWRRPGLGTGETAAGPGGLA